MASSRSVVPKDTARHEGSKALGAFYTPPEVADFLVWWAVRSPSESVLDPSFGGGVFLRAAAEHIAALGGDPARRVFGVEINGEVHAAVASWLSRECGIPDDNLILSDFFEMAEPKEPTVDAVVGNPPFIRYQRFTGTARERALATAERHGVTLSRLTSSWAPFLVHAAAMLRQGGRLAFVVPMEIGYATYARPVLAYLAKSFAKVTFVAFREKLFPGLSEDTMLLLAEDKGPHDGRFVCRELSRPGQLEDIRRRGRRTITAVRKADAKALAEGRARLAESLISRRAGGLYEELKNGPLTARLGDIASVGIGYVTGANDFFHLDPLEAAQWGIPSEFLLPAVRRGRSLRGARLTKRDWREGLASGDTGYLLSIDGQGELPRPVVKYIAYGEERGVHKAYKCRKRSPWYCVPHVYVPDAFLTYMSGAVPKLVANVAKAVSPNSLHIVRIRVPAVSGEQLAAFWQNSLTRLSAEIEGHALGGGMLKLEPKEAGRVLLPVANGPGLGSLAGVLDRLCRERGALEAQRFADREVLQKRLGLSERDCRMLRSAAETLMRRRYGKERNGSHAHRVPTH